MAFQALTDAEIQPDKPVSQSLWQKVKDNFDAHEAALQGGGSGSASIGVIPNGSLEADSDQNGIPDNWTVGTYSGGSRGYDLTDWAHGTRAYKFVATLSGGVNGGGWMLSDYVGVSPIYIPPLWFGYKASVADIRVRVTAQYYGVTGAGNSPGSLLGTVVLWDSTSHKAGAWTMAVICRQPVISNARYVKYLFEGGVQGGVAGSVWFDGIGVEPFVGPSLISHGINLPATSPPYWNENFIGSAFGFTLPSGLYSLLHLYFDVDPYNFFWDPGIGSGAWYYIDPSIRCSIDNGAIYTDYWNEGATGATYSPYQTTNGYWSTLGYALPRHSLSADISSLSAGAHTARFRGYFKFSQGTAPRIKSENLGHYLVNTGRQIDGLTGAVVDVAGKPTVLTIP